ncbi:MAG: alpha/beta hydrolase [Hyphomicrobiaceae bacterium]|nr:alpha/beta hydrolase [Hyphomicrobiaceae bacterium]
MTAQPREVVFKGVSGNNLTADAWGDEGQQSVVFLHGGGQTRHAWGGTAARVAAAGWYTVSVDLRGHGESDWTDSYSHTEFGRDVIEVVRQIGGRPVLVGASLGGISALFAEDMTDGELCSALVLVDIAPQINPEGVERILSFMKSGAAGFATVEDAANAVAGYLRERKRPGDVSGLKKNLRRKSDGRWYWHWDPRFLDHTPEDRTRHQSELEAAARRLRVPTLLVRGSASDVLTEQGVQSFQKCVPHASYVDIAGAGHMVAGDRNDAFSEAIFSFLGMIEKADVA